MPRLAPRPRHLAAALLLLATACAGLHRAPRELRVLVYNVHAGKDAAGVDNVARVAAIVRETSADLVLLQEVDSVTARSGRVDQLAALARATGRHGAFGHTLDYQGGGYGIALLSRWPLARHAVTPLRIEPPQPRAGGSLEPRGALVAELRAPRLAVVNTHLDASREDRWRLQEATRLLELLAPLRAGDAVVLAGGDLNAEPSSAVLAQLRAAGLRDVWAECGSGDGLSYPADRPVKRIDYLLLSGPVRCTAARVLDSQASDHRGVLFTLRLR